MYRVTFSEGQGDVLGRSCPQFLDTHSDVSDILLLFCDKSFIYTKNISRSVGLEKSSVV